MFAHLVAKDAGFNGEGDFSRAGWLRAVADDASSHAQSVFQGVRDDVEAFAHEVGNAAACRTTRTHRTTIGRKPTDASLLVDGDEVGEGHSADGAFLVDAELFSVGEDGQAYCHALVAAARVDDDGHLTAAHAGVAACCCPGLGFLSHVVVEAEQGAANVGAPFALQAFHGDGFVASHLSLDDGTQVGEVGGGGEVVNFFHFQALAVGHVGVGVGALALKKRLAVLLNADHVGVVPRNADARRMVAIVEAHSDV